MDSVCELGDQMLYASGFPYGSYPNKFYQDHLLAYFCIDMNGQNNCWTQDMGKPYDPPMQFDLLTDFGFMEHVATNFGLPDPQFDWECVYNCWLNKHKLLKNGGVMVGQNPKTGNWPNHNAFNYIDKEFYPRFCVMANYRIIETGEEAAMGNVTDGWNIYAILEKYGEKFPTLEQFKTLPIFTS
jgi:hypothetical protein